MITREKPMTGGYFDNYIGLVGEGNIIDILENLRNATADFFNTIDEKKSLYSYAQGKWTIKEVVGHLCDAERIFAYRALRFARKDSTVLSPFDQDDYVAVADFNSRSFTSLKDEFKMIRDSNIQLFRSFNDDVLSRKGTSGTTQVSVESLLYIIAGHEIHHIKILKEKYF